MRRITSDDSRHRSGNDPECMIGVTSADEANTYASHDRNICMRMIGQKRPALCCIRKGRPEISTGSGGREASGFPGRRPGQAPRRRDSTAPTSAHVIEHLMVMIMIIYMIHAYARVHMCILYGPVIARAPALPLRRGARLLAPEHPKRTSARARSLE